jgi:hypothetical protein
VSFHFLQKNRLLEHSAMHSKIFLSFLIFFRRTCSVSYFRPPQWGYSWVYRVTGIDRIDQGECMQTNEETGRLLRTTTYW